jgi:hypothetical protein
MEHLCACRQRENSAVSSELLDDALTIEEALMPLESIFKSLVCIIEDLQRQHDTFQGHGIGTVDSAGPTLSFERSQIIAHQENARFLVKKHASLLQLFDKTFAIQHQRVMLDDSATVKVITIITLVYLSFTVVGVSLLTTFYGQG